MRREIKDDRQVKIREMAAEVARLAGSTSLIASGDLPLPASELRDGDADEGVKVCTCERVNEGGRS